MQYNICVKNMCSLNLTTELIGGWGGGSKSTGI